MGKKVWLTGKVYERSDVWRCPKAPINPDIELQALNQTGAHYWRQMDQTEKLREGGYYRCCYCGDVKKFPTRFSYDLCYVMNEGGR